MRNTTHSWATLKRVSAAVTGIATAILITVPQAVTASSWDPTLLVNTESFQVIDDGDGDDIFLQFGDAADERLTWDVSESRFRFSDDLAIEGNLDVDGDISASGALTINADATGDATITVGNASGNETITFTDATQEFDFSAAVDSAGKVSGSQLSGDDLVDCENIYTDGTGLLICGDGSQLDDRFVNTSGDTMTGDLNVRGGNVNTDGTFSASGAITLGDNNAADTVLTFGDTTTPATITYNKTTGDFDFSTGINTTASITGSRLAVTGSDVSLNGVEYRFTDTQGGAGQVLVNDGAGELTWQDVDSTQGAGSGAQMSLHPQYPNTSYDGDGSNNVGRLRVLSEGTAAENYYRWTTTKNSQQDYDIVTRVRVPENFDSWLGSAAAIELQYRTAGTSDVDISIYDTAGVLDHTTTGLSNAAFAIDNTLSTDLTGTYTAGGYMTVRIQVSSQSGGSADVGYLNFNWLTTTP